MKKILLFLLVLAACNQPQKPLGFSLSRVGQTIVHLKGVMPGVIATGKSNITYVADSNVIFTSPIQLGNTSNIKFDGKLANGGYGFRSNAPAAAFTFGSGNNLYDSITNFDFGNLPGTGFDAATKIFVKNQILTWDGTPKSAVCYGLFVDSFTVSGARSLFSGTFEPPTTKHMYVVGPTFTNGIFVNDKTSSNTKISGNSFYGFRIDTWRLTGPTINNVDCGIIFFAGSGTMKNIYRNGGWGYIERLWITKIANIPFDQTCGLYNCVDVNSTHYGTVDVRNEGLSQAAGTSGGDFYYINNTSLNKVDGPQDGSTNAPNFGCCGYVTNAVVLGSMMDDLGKAWTIHIKNSFAGNADARSGMSNGSSLLKQNAAGNTFVMDSSNNLDLPSGKPIPSGLVDSNYYPIKGSILDIKGIGATPVAKPIPPNPPNPCPPVDTLAIQALKVCPPPPKVDTAAIQALKVCPPADTSGIIKWYISGHPCPPIPVYPIKLTTTQTITMSDGTQKIVSSSYP